MKRLLLLVFAALLSACISPHESGVKVIVGAKLDPGAGQAPVDYSVVVITNGKFTAVGPEATTPVPPGAEMTRGIGMTIEPIPGSNPIKAGQPANLVLKGAANSAAADRVMRNGDWVAGPAHD